MANRRRDQELDGESRKIRRRRSPGHQWYRADEPDDLFEVEELEQHRRMERRDMR